jgi:soluble lytic murein transglycosylase-like protein
MSATTMIKTACEAGTLRRLALAAACLFLLNGNQVAAQAVGTRAAIDISVFTLPDDEADADASQPSLPPLVLKAQTSADLPPSSPLGGSLPRTLSPLGGSLPRTSVAFGRDWRAGRNEYRALVERESSAFGLPPALVDAIMAVESRYNPASIGLDGEVGLMQLMPPTARMLGFTGSLAELAAPEVNVHYGTKYLAGAWRLAGGDLCTAAMKYRAGHGETRFSFLSVDYCLRVRSHLAANGVAVSGPVPQATFGRSGGAQPRGRSISGGSTVNFAALNTRLRALTDRKTPNASN